MVTLKEIAKLAKVNVSTVSRALNNSHEVGEEKKREIVELARSLNYTPDLSARSLVGKPTRLIGIVVPEIESNYYVQIVKSAEARLNAQGYNLMVSTTGFDCEKELQNIEVFVGRKADGIVLVASSAWDSVTRLLSGGGRRLPVPAVFIEPDTVVQSSDCVLIDGLHGYRLAIEHLLHLGHRKIGFIGEDISTRYRLPLFTKAMEEQGLKPDPCFVRSGKERFEIGGYLRMREMLRDGALPTAIMAAYDSIAVGVLKAANEAGLKIPGDISLIGYDNIREAEFLSPPLTTIFPPVEELVDSGIGMLIERIGSRSSSPASAVWLRPELIIRASMGPAVSR